MRLKKIAAAAALAALSFVAGAQPVRVADSLPAGHYFTEQGLKFWMSEVRRLTNNAVEFQHFPAEQLGKAKDMFQLAMTGVADVSYFVPGYVSDKMPLMTVTELPGFATSSCHGTNAFMKLARGGAIDKKELAPLGYVVLFGVILRPYELYATKKIDTLASVQGMKVRTSGGVQGALIKELGGVPVSMPSNDAYDALMRGTIDGIAANGQIVLAFDMQNRLLKGATQDANLGAALAGFGISRKKLDSLPADVRQAMLTAGETTAKKVCTFLDENDAINRAKIKAAGVNYTTLGDADMQKLADLMSAMQKDWAAQLDKRGKPGTEVLEAYRGALK